MASRSGPTAAMRSPSISACSVAWRLSSVAARRSTPACRSRRCSGSSCAPGRRRPVRDDRLDLVRRGVERHDLERPGAAPPDLFVDTSGFDRIAGLELAFTVGLLLMVGLVAGIYRLGVAGMRLVDQKSQCRRAGAALLDLAGADRVGPTSSRT